MLDVGGSQIWNATTAVLAIMLAFRTRQGLMRFWQGTGLLHQMRGEWFDTVSNCITFSISAKKDKPEEVTKFRHTLVRLMSRCHGSALEEIAENSIQLEAVDTFGLDNGTLTHLKECHEVHGFNKVEVMLHLVQSLITRAHDDGLLKVPPPILSRVYQTISRGFVNLLNAKKITDTRFPFPFSQLIAFLLLSHVVLTPLMISSIVRSKVMATIFTFVPITGFFSLNFIAIELENPFGTDANDLPMEHFQVEMNQCLLMLLHHNTDMITGVSEDCVLEFEALLAKVHWCREQGEANRLSAYGTDENGSTEPLEEENAPEQIGLSTPPADGPATVGFATAGTTPESDAAAQAAAQAAAKATLGKVVDEFEAGFTKWMKSVDDQMTQMKESFDSIKKFNEDTSAMIMSPELGLTSHPGWEAAISPT